MKKKVYLAGASSEMPRVKAMVGQIIASGCLTLTHDWSSGSEWDAVPPVSEAELDVRTRQRLMGDDVQGVMDAEVFWMLAPGRMPTQHVVLRAELHKTKGAWFELGVAHTLRTLRPWPGIRPTIIVSGSECYQSIFTEAAQHFFDTDMLALEWLKKKAGQ